MLIDLMLNSWWLHLPAHEATLRGAAAIIFTIDPAVDDSYYTIAPDALGSNDGLYGRTWVRPCTSRSRTASRSRRSSWQALW